MSCLRIAIFFWIIGILTACNNADISIYKSAKNTETEEKAITISEEQLKADIAKKATMASLAHSIAEDKAKATALSTEIELAQKTDAVAKAQAASDTDEIEKYKQKIQAKVTRNWQLPADKHGSCQVQVKLLSNGGVVDVHVISCTGDALFKRLAEVAVRLSSPLPLPSDRALFPHFRVTTFNIQR